MQITKKTYVKITVRFRNHAELAVVQQAFERDRKLANRYVNIPAYFCKATWSDTGVVIMTSPELASKFTDWFDELNVVFAEEIDWLNLAQKAREEWAKHNKE